MNVGDLEKQLIGVAKDTKIVRRTSWDCAQDFTPVFLDLLTAVEATTGLMEETIKTHPSEKRIPILLIS